MPRRLAVCCTASLVAFAVVTVTSYGTAHAQDGVEDAVLEFTEEEALAAEAELETAMLELQEPAEAGAETEVAEDDGAPPELAAAAEGTHAGERAGTNVHANGAEVGAEYEDGAEVGAEYEEGEGELSGELLAAATEALRVKLAESKQRVLAGILAKLEAKRERSMGAMSNVLWYLSLGGFLLLLAPLALRRRYPGRDGILLKYSALAAFTFFFAVNLFSVALFTLRGAQSVASEYTNPQMAMVEGAFSVLEEDVESLVPMADWLLGPTLDQLEAGEESSMTVALLNNLQTLREDVTVFTEVARMFEGLGWILGYLPVVLAILTAVLFLVAFRDVLIDVVKMPVRAVENPTLTGRQMVGATARSIGREMLATLSLVGVLVAITLLSGALLVQLVTPAMEALLAFVVSGVMYMQLVEDVSTAGLFVSLSATALFLLLTVVAVLAANGMFLAKVQKVFRLRFHDQVPVSTHRRFWLFGAGAVLWTHVLPLLFMLAVVPGIEWVFGAFLESEEPRFLTAMLVSSLLLVLGLAVAMVLGRVFRGLGFLAFWKPEVAASVPEPGVDANDWQPPAPSPGL